MKPEKIELARPILRYTDGLPIHEKRGEILGALAANQIIIVAGETGSGKTTQLPVMCIEAGRGIRAKIGCTQPRRLAATSIAARVASELRCTLGNEVGYKIRFSDHDSPRTSIKFMTDGILLAETERDPMLAAYDTLIIDEAHERSLNIDFLLGYLRNLLPKRTDLKVIISSATIDTTLFSRAFGNAPIIEVSGRLFPVELLYRQDNDISDEDGNDASYVDRAIAAVHDLVDMYGPGDMLVFMPTERDIREACDRLAEAKIGEAAILPLFARLTRSEQERIFSSHSMRKIVVSTNIAETSITVPGIRFVVDTGYARISRYAPRLRTNRLPIEPISRASADQRKGRCGRVQDGVCVRLYTQADFQERESFTDPEIRRSDLAGVILTMIAHRLGTIDTFPFLEPPSKQAITDGYASLRELGALDRENNLTSTGREMARLPLDPHIARMVLAARQENVLREVKIITSALSIVDPRERPLDKQNEADAMHKRFVDPSSDFLTYVRLWDAFREQWGELKTQTRMRTFCKDHFLSFNRMREWHDVHQQLCDMLSRMSGFTENTAPASSDCIHRALLTGLLSNCAIRGEKGWYRAARGRDVRIFPGSALIGKNAEWIMCHEVIETSQVFARTVAAINPLWLEQLAPHLCTHSFDAPRYDTDLRAVVATERVTLFGLSVATREKVRYGKVNPEAATALFISEALVNEQLVAECRFYTHNKLLRSEIEQAESKLRTRSLFAGESAIETFYQARLKGVSSAHDLFGAIKAKGSDDFLRMRKEDLLSEPVPGQIEQFPDSVNIGGKNFVLQYAFEPGEKNDGITLHIPEETAPHVPEHALGWLLPALWPQRIAEILRSLPKELRKQLAPVNVRAAELAAVLSAGPRSFEAALAEAIEILYKIKIDPAQLTAEKQSAHLTLRVEIHDAAGSVVAEARGAGALREIKRRPGQASDSPWNEMFAHYEQKGLTSWSFGEIPEHIEITSLSQSVPFFAYPALRAAEQSVDLVMCGTAQEARETHRKGIARLLEISFTKEFAWVERELSFGSELKVLCATLGGAQKLAAGLLAIARRYAIDIGEHEPRTQEAFLALVQLKKENLHKAGFELMALLEQVVRSLSECSLLIAREHRSAFQEIRFELKGDLETYIDEVGSCLMSLERFRQFPRYLRAFSFRVQRAFVEPARYRERRQSLRGYQERLEKLRKECPLEKVTLLKELEFMVEEFAISLFAQQEVKTTMTISAKRIEKKIAEFGF